MLGVTELLLISLWELLEVALSLELDATATGVSPDTNLRLLAGLLVELSGVMHKMEEDVADMDMEGLLKLLPNALLLLELIPPAWVPA